LEPGCIRLRVKESEASAGNPLAVEVQAVRLAPTRADDLRIPPEAGFY